MLYGEYAFDYPRKLINDQLIGQDNLALVFTRQTKENFGVLAVNIPLGQHKIVSSYDSSYFATLYNYSDPTGTFEKKTKNANLNAEIVEKISDRINETIDPVELFDYIYGMLHTPSYLNKYQDILKIDYPRVPYPTDADKYHRIANIGKKLRLLHTMYHSSDWPLDVKYPIGGIDRIEKVRYKDGRVYINESQYFDNVNEDAWNAYIGGYQPAQKWLKERKGRTLSFDDLNHYCKIIHILNETAKITSEMESLK